MSTFSLLSSVCWVFLLLLTAALWLNERGAFDAMARFLPRSAAERLLLAVVIVGFIHYGANLESRR